jgi:hypothetical protein
MKYYYCYSLRLPWTIIIEIIIIIKIIRITIIIIVEIILEHKLTVTTVLGAIRKEKRK